jgi:hypothetical protein
MTDKDYQGWIIQALQKSRDAGKECPNGWDCKIEVVHLLGNTYDYCTEHYKKHKREKDVSDRTTK